MPRPIGSCFGPRNHARIFDEFDIWPITHQVLLPPCEKSGCAGILTGEYYLFGYRERNARDPNESGTFFCGTHCAERLLELFDLESLQRFNPLTVAPTSTGGESGQDQSDRLRLPWDPLNTEVYCVINLLVAIRDVAPTGPTLNTLEWIIRDPSRRVLDRRVLTLNNYVRAIYGGHSFQSVLIAFRQQRNPSLRHFDFPRIRHLLQCANTQNFIDP